MTRPYRPATTARGRGGGTSAASALPSHQYARAATNRMASSAGQVPQRLDDRLRPGGHPGTSTSTGITSRTAPVDPVCPGEHPAVVSAVTDRDDNSRLR